jgi:translation initiation factor IF-3
VNFTRDVSNKRPVDTHEINERIRALEVRIIESEKYTGVYKTAEALRIAENEGLDLVLVNSGPVPPLCRIIDYGKFKYDIAQREKEQKKKARESVVEVKEIQLRPVTDTNDIIIKAKRAVGFLADGDKVKIVVKFKGRELSHREMGQKILESFCKSVGEPDTYRIDSPVSMNGRQMMMIIAPIKKIS